MAFLYTQNSKICGKRQCLRKKLRIYGYDLVMQFVLIVSCTFRYKIAHAHHRPNYDCARSTVHFT